MRLIDADAFFEDICDSLNQMTNIGVAVDANWLWAKLNDALENATTVNQWIPCSERLPEKGLRVLMCLDNAWQMVGWYDKEDKQWYALAYSQSIDTFLFAKVIAWMPLPPSYKGDDNE